MVDSVELLLAISARDYQLHYRQPGTLIWARATDGRRIQFPASLVQRFVDHSGIHGRFRIEFAGGRCTHIERVPVREAPAADR